MTPSSQELESPGNPGRFRLEIDGNQDASFDRGYGILIDGPVAEVTLRNLIVHDVGTLSGFANGIGIREASPAFVYNNIVYDILSSDPSGAGGTAYGIVDENTGSSTAFIYNNTVFNVHNDRSTSTANVYGIVVPDSPNHTVQNNIVIDSTKAVSGNAQDYCAYTGALGGGEACSSPIVNATFQYNMSSDLSAIDNPSGTYLDHFRKFGEFKDTADSSEDLHLVVNASAIDVGTTCPEALPQTSIAIPASASGIWVPMRP